MDQNYKNSTYYSIIAIVYYVLIFFIGSSFITLLIARIMSNADISYDTLIAAITSSDYLSLPDNVKKLSAITQAFSNLFTYLITAAIVIFLLRRDILKDFIKTKSKWLFYLIYTIIAMVLFLVITNLIENICSKYAPESNNQSIIVFIYKNGGAIPTIIFTVILAPILEELIYRKAIFTICKKVNLALAYAASILAFTLPHVLSSDMTNFGVWLIVSIPYFLSAILLALIYDKSNENILVTILIHMANNIYAIILFS